MSHRPFGGANVVVYPPKHPRPSMKPASFGRPEKVAGERGEILRENENERGRSEWEREKGDVGDRETTAKTPSSYKEEVEPGAEEAAILKTLSPPPSKEEVAEREEREREAPLPLGRAAEREVRGKFIMQDYLRDERRQLELMTICADAIAACLQCEQLSFRSDLDCANICRQCSTQMMPALKLLASNSPRVAEVVYLSTLLADDCVKECRGMNERFCQTCAESCARWSNAAKAALEECAQSRERATSSI